MLRPTRALPLALVSFGLLGAALLGASGCHDRLDDSTPSGALRLFVDAMDRSDWDAHALKDAYHLLAPATRAQLVARARRAEELAGRRLKPWELIAQGRFHLRFVPRDRGGMVERIHGDHATIVVRGAGAGERAEVSMVREGRHWRLLLDLPPIGS